MPLHRTLEEILGAFMDAMKNEIVKVRIATVTAVSNDRQTVDVQLATNNPLYDDAGNVFTEPAPSISDVPLAVLRGGGFMVWLPVAVGDSVLLLFSDLSIDTWRAGDGTPQDPGFVGKHTLDSALALPMFGIDKKMFADPASAGGAGKIIIGKDQSSAQIRISATDIELGNNATDAVALASLVNGELQKIATAFSTFAPGSGGASFPDAYTSPSNVASATVKAQ